MKVQVYHHIYSWRQRVDDYRFGDIVFLYIPKNLYIQKCVVGICPDCKTPIKPKHISPHQLTIRCACPNADHPDPFR